MKWKSKKSWQEKVAGFKDQSYDVAKCVRPCGSVENGAALLCHIGFHEGNQGPCNGLCST